VNSLRLRLSIWFGASFLAVTALFLSIAYWHLDHELRQEKWERAHPDHPDWLLHGNYSDGEVRDIVGELTRFTLLTSLPMVATALLIGYFLARKSTRPVTLLNAELRSIHPKNLDRRLAVSEADPEFRSVQEQINQLLDRIENSFRQLNEFSGKVAHELRTPLTLLRLQVERAADKIEPELSDSLQDELKRLSDYVDQALLVARAEQGRVALRPERIDLRDLIEEMIDVYCILAAEAGRAIAMRCDADCAVLADRKHLRHIFHNLISNALKHGEGTIAIHVARRCGKPTCTILNRIGNEKAPEGIGFGLRIVSALAAQHDDVHFRSRSLGRWFAAALTFAACLETQRSPLPATANLQQRPAR
jgi:signal transduction histidine kinase